MDMRFPHLLPVATAIPILMLASALPVAAESAPPVQATCPTSPTLAVTRITWSRDYVTWTVRDLTRVTVSFTATLNGQAVSSRGHVALFSVRARSERSVTTRLIPNTTNILTLLSTTATGETCILGHAEFKRAGHHDGRDSHRKAAG